MTNAYIKEIAPWEKKQPYFKSVRFGYLENIHNNIDNIKEGIRIQNETFLKSANTIFMHADAKTETLAFFHPDNQKILNGISGLEASFEWGISDVLWLIEQQRDVYKQLLSHDKQNENSTTTQLKTNAQNSYSKGWFEESLKDYIKIEKREAADYSVYFSIGIIYLFHLIHKEKALGYFEKAAAWAKSRSTFYTSYALIFQALIHQDLGQIEVAEQLTRTAAAKTPDFSFVLYQNAMLNAMLGRSDAVIPQLQKAAHHDLRFYLKALQEPAFNSFKPKINTLMQEDKKRRQERAEKVCLQIREAVNEINNLLRQYNDKYRTKQIAMDKEALTEIESGLAELNRGLSRDSLMDYAVIDHLVRNSQFTRMIHQVHKKIYHNVMAQRKEFIKPFEKKIESVRHRCNLLSSENTSGLGQILLSIFYLGFGTIGAVSTALLRPGIPSVIIGAIVGFILALAIQFCIKRYGENYEIDYSDYDTYNEIETFLGALKKIEQKLPAFTAH